MKYLCWRGLVLAGFALMPLYNLPLTAAVTMAQVVSSGRQISAYDKSMELGYTQTKRRNYRAALEYFQEALQWRPGDRYAEAAIRNVNSYIERRGRSIVFVTGRPLRRANAGARGDTEQDCKNAQPIPLTVGDDTPQLTLSSHPTFLFYIPKTKTNQPIKRIRFSLEDDSGEPIHRETVNDFSSRGVININLPTHQQSLEVGKQYTWKFTTSCNLTRPELDRYVTGKIEVIKDENLSAQIQQTSNPLEQARLYATAGVWENAVSTLANLRRQRPNDPEVQQYWLELLESVDLQDVASQPLLGCCTPK